MRLSLISSSLSSSTSLAVVLLFCRLPSLLPLVHTLAFTRHHLIVHVLTLLFPFSSYALWTDPQRFTTKEAMKIQRQALLSDEPLERLEAADGNDKEGEDDEEEDEGEDGFVVPVSDYAARLDIVWNCVCSLATLFRPHHGVTWWCVLSAGHSDPLSLCFSNLSLSFSFSILSLALHSSVVSLPFFSRARLMMKGSRTRYAVCVAHEAPWKTTLASGSNAATSCVRRGSTPPALVTWCVVQSSGQWIRHEHL